MPGSQEKRSQDILDDLAIKVAKMHYEEALEPSEIARQLKKEGIRDARDARVLIQRARDRKLASVKVEPTLTSPRDFGLEEELRVLTEIRCLVAKTKLAITSENLDSDDPDERQRAQQDNGDLHRQLGDPVKASLGAVESLGQLEYLLSSLSSLGSSLHPGHRFSPWVFPGVGSGACGNLPVGDHPADASLVRGTHRRLLIQVPLPFGGLLGEDVPLVGLGTTDLPAGGQPEPLGGSSV